MVLRLGIPVADYPAYALNYSVSYKYTNGSLPEDCSRKTGEKFLSEAFVHKRDLLQAECLRSNQTFAKVNVHMTAFVAVYPDTVSHKMSPGNYEIVKLVWTLAV